MIDDEAPRSRIIRRADRIRADVPITQVLADLGYRVNPSSDNSQKQFACDLHSDGRDTKPSGRIYGRSNSFHCWGCGRSRDAIAVIREKGGLSFADAVRWLEKKYGLPDLPWEASDETPQSLESEIAEITSGSRPVTLDETLGRIARILETAGVEKALPVDRLALYWESHDGIAYHAREGRDVRPTAAKLWEKLTAEIVGGAA